MKNTYTVEVGMAGSYITHDYLVRAVEGTP